jgi:CshA-type fibril repeat protein
MVQDQTATTPADPVTIPVLADATAGDTAIAHSSLRLIDPSTSNEVASVTISGQGTYTANADGTVTFTPVIGFTGMVTNVQFVVYDANNAVSNTATISTQVNFHTIVANDDTFAISVDGGTAGNVLLNDTLQGSFVDTSKVTTTLLDGAGSGATIDSIGKVTIPANTSAAVYPLLYKICEVNYPTNCSQATATVTVLALTAVDSDNDGIMDQIENDGPNNGDANNDGVPDRFEKNVATFVGTVTGRYKTLEMDSVCQINAVDMVVEPTNPIDIGYTYPMGLMNFTANCGTPGFTAAVTQYYFDTPDDNYVLRKYDPNSKDYFTIGSAALQPLSVGGRSAVKAIFTVTDGDSLDMDGNSNGTIVDPAGLALSTTVSMTSNPSTSGLADTGQNMVAIGVASLLSIGLSTGVFVRRHRAYRGSLW